MEIFRWADFKSTAIIKELGKISLNEISLNEINPPNQFATLSCSSGQTYHIIGGYIDNTVKIYKQGYPVHTIAFHTVVFYLSSIINIKKIATAVDAAYIARVKGHYIVVGSKDCLITIWKFSADTKDIQRMKQGPLILYEHHNEITALYIEKTLGIIISSDKV